MERFSYTIEHDDNPMNPRREFDNLGTMYCEHRRYDLGDKDADDPRQLDQRTIAVMLPLFLYDHSGITMNTTGFYCPWDSGQVGVIYITREKVLKEYGWKVLTKQRKEKLAQYLNAEVETYDQYLTGEVYGYIITDDEGEEVESCWGFYGEEYCEEEAKAVTALFEASTPKQHPLDLVA